MFRVGMNVVCLKRNGWHCPATGRFVDGPKLNEVLAIDGFDVHGGLLFNRWLHNDHYPDGSPRGYLKTRFRPVVSRKTDISQLQALLVPGAKIREDA